MNKVESIVWFDLETTGVNIATDRIIEICLIKTDLEGNHIETFESLVNPGDIEIRPEAQEKHGISIEELQDYEGFEHIAKTVFDFIGDSHLGGYNAMRFDIPLLVEEFMRVGIVFDFRKRAIIDPFLIMAKYEPRDLGSVYERLIGKPLENAHRATADIEATMQIFSKQKEKYNMSNDLIEIDSFVNDQRKDMVDLSGKLIFKEIDGKRRIVFNFGKWNGISIKEAFDKDARYFDWIIDKGEFTNETKIIVKKLLNRLKSDKPFEY